jgi:hypothetical protein
MTVAVRRTHRNTRSRRRARPDREICPRLFRGFAAAAMFATDLDLRPLLDQSANQNRAS